MQDTTSQFKMKFFHTKASQFKIWFFPYIRYLTGVARNNAAWDLYGTSAKTLPTQLHSCYLITNTTTELLSCPWESTLSVLQSWASSWRTAHTFLTTHAENGKSKLYTHILHTKLQVDTMLFDSIYRTYRPANFLFNQLTGSIFWNLGTWKKEITHRI